MTVTAVPARALPTPLPAKNQGTVPLGSPDMWQGREILRVDGSFKDGEGHATPASATYKPGALVSDGQTYNLVTLHPTSSNDEFVAAGKDFTQAVREANRAAKFVSHTSNAGRSWNQAIAVLKDNNGSFYLTAPRNTSDGLLHEATMDAKSLRPGVTVTNVEPLSPAVQAVVDSSEWVNFSKNNAKVDLARVSNTAQ